MRFFVASKNHVGAMALCNASLHICMHFEKGAIAVIRILEQSHIESIQNCAEIFQKKFLMYVWRRRS